jgi:hypothetical protein
MAQEENDSEIADTNVIENDDGSYTATATTTDGDTGSGSSQDGIVTDASAEEAVAEATADAKD